MFVFLTNVSIGYNGRADLYNVKENSLSFNHYDFISPHLSPKKYISIPALEELHLLLGVDAPGTGGRCSSVCWCCTTLLCQSIIPLDIKKLLLVTIP